MWKARVAVNDGREDGLESEKSKRSADAKVSINLGAGKLDICEHDSLSFRPLCKKTRMLSGYIVLVYPSQQSWSLPRKHDTRRHPHLQDRSHLWSAEGDDIKVPLLLCTRLQRSDDFVHARPTPLTAVRPITVPWSRRPISRAASDDRE